MAQLICRVLLFLCIGIRKQQFCVRRDSRNGNINNQILFFSLTQPLYNAVRLAYLLESHLWRWQRHFKKGEGLVKLLSRSVPSRIIVRRPLASLLLLLLLFGIKTNREALNIFVFCAWVILDKEILLMRNLPLSNKELDSDFILSDSTETRFTFTL